MNSKWRPVTAREPCPICGKGDRCGWSADGTAISCLRVSDAPPNWIRIKESGNGGIFKRSATKRSTTSTIVNWANEAEKCKDAISSERAEKLAGELGVTSESLRKLGIGWADSNALREWNASGDGWHDNRPTGAYTFPERSGDGRIVGLSLRAEDGRKGAPSGKRTGSKRGLVVPLSLATRAEPVLVVEGASDVAALESLGLAAIGRPSNTGGANDLAGMLRDRDVLVVGERDQKPDGTWPGRDGAERVASRLATKWKRSVPYALPPEGSKDVRDWLRSRNLDLTDEAACTAAGVELLTALRGSVKATEPAEEPSQAELLVQLALELYVIGADQNGQGFAVEQGGPNVALMFTGSTRALKAALAREYRRRHKATPNASALNDALTVLEGEAQEADRESVFLRIAEHQGGVVIDLGRQDGKVVIVNADGWRLHDRSPVLFRRSELTSEMPMPERDGSIEALRDLVNVTDETWELVLAWLVASLIPECPHPILMLGGLHGTGKTTAARMFVAIIDPSSAPTRSAPSNDRDWAVMAFASWMMVFDNVSTIAVWWSDALCKSVTGDGYPFRKLYTNSELSVIAFRRVSVITSIDAGALRGDLGDRLLLIDLEAIDDARRRTEKELARIFGERQPKILGALLDLVSRVLKELPNVKLPGMPRLADFACVVAAMDTVLGTHALGLFLGQRERIAVEVIESDAVGVAVMAFMTDRTEWTGTPKELLRELTPQDRIPHGWPKFPRGLTGRLKRLLPALKSVGIRVVLGARKAGGERDRQVSLLREEPAGGDGW
jgi:hypothetical protein